MCYIRACSDNILYQSVIFHTSYISAVKCLLHVQSISTHAMTYRPLQLELPDLVVGVDLHIAVGPGVVHRDARGHLHTGGEVNLDAHLGFNSVLKVTRDLNTSTHKSLSGK